MHARAWSLEVRVRGMSMRDDRRMTVLLDDTIHVHYGFVTLAVEGDYPDFAAAREGQVNGLCGAAEPEALVMVTGMHTGAVPFRIEVHAERPELDESWEEIVEASISIPEGEMLWWAFDEGGAVQFPHVGTYRTRYNASGMDAAHQSGVREADEPEIDKYLLQLWPAPMAPDEVIRQTSETAAYWHRVARGEDS